MSQQAPETAVKQRYRDRKIRQGKRKLQVWLSEEVYQDLHHMATTTGMSKTRLLSTMIPIFKQQMEESNE